MTTFNDLVENRIDESDVLEEALFNYVPVSQALDSLAERTNMWWYIDENRFLYFVKRDKYQSPWTATGEDMLTDSVSVSHENSKYRNRQIIKGGRDITSEQTEIKRGDGDSRSFSVGFPIAKKPTIEVSRDGDDWEEKEVGIKGLDEDKEWYWEQGDNTIKQDDSKDVLTNDDRVRITYIGEFPIVVIAQDNTQINKRKQVEGIGTGIVEEVKDEPEQTDREAGFQLAGQLLEKYGTIGRRLKFRTRRKGLKPGQLLEVDLPEHDITNNKMLIENIRTVDQNGVFLDYEVRAIEGPEKKSWAKVFEEILKKTDLKVREGVGEDEVVIQVFEFEKDWEESEHPNIFHEKYPASVLEWSHYESDTWEQHETKNWEEFGLVEGTEVYPSNDTYPMFDFQDRVKYIEWYHDGEPAGRKQITQQEGEETDEVYALVFLEQMEAVGNVTDFAWIGGFRATEELGTGIEIDKQSDPIEGEALPIEKTQLDAWQIEKTYRKW